MVEFLALWLYNAGISPLILTRGYAGGDEARMLQRHLLYTSTKIGIGANRAAMAAQFFKRFGYLDPCHSMYVEGLCSDKSITLSSKSDKIGVVILDDGMQHWSLSRDLEIVMVNGVMPWGNTCLVPLGPLREPLYALQRADIAIIHHADLVSDQELIGIEATIRELKQTLPIFFTRLAPSCFFNVKDCDTKLPLRVMHNTVILCVSAIGSANAFVWAIEKLEPAYVDRMDFIDHYLFQMKDIEVILEKLRVLQIDYGTKPVVVVTEKDYDRDSLILKRLDPFEVLVLCSRLEIVPSVGNTEKTFQKLLKQLLEISIFYKRGLTAIEEENSSLMSDICQEESIKREELQKSFTSLARPLSVSNLSASAGDGSKERVAYKGVPGAFSEVAALKAYSKCEAVPCDDFEVAFKAVELWLVNKTILPIESSIGGSVRRNYDLLLRHRLHIVGEIQLVVNHCLMALPGVRKEELHRVLSHPQALTQCEISLGKLRVVKEAVDSTAGAAQDDSDNVTRFLILAREPIFPITGRPFKTSIVFTLEEGPGILFKALAIESRPQRNRPLRVVNDSKNAGEIAKFLQVLGCYPMDVSL
ncbi:hypothetical protein MKX01_022269 [Papaver californicum]|nr:hypothetical protein MKX01_022269 [Papaver californicum]